MPWITNFWVSDDVYALVKAYVNKNAESFSRAEAIEVLLVAGLAATAEGSAAGQESLTHCRGAAQQ